MMAPVKPANVMSTYRNDLGFLSALVSSGHICHYHSLNRPPSWATSVTTPPPVLLPLLPALSPCPVNPSGLIVV